MLKSILHFLTFNLFKKTTIDSLELFDNGYYAYFNPYEGVSEKTMRKTFLKICGKNLEYVMGSFEGYYTVSNFESNFTGNDLFDYMMKYSSRMFHGIELIIIGKGAKFLKKILKDQEDVKYKGIRIRLSPHTHTRIRSNFLNSISNRVHEYRKLAALKSVKGFPAECPSCKKEFGQIEVQLDEDGDWAGENLIEVEDDGSCNSCGAFVGLIKEEHIIDLYHDIRKFEEKSGASIFPKAA